MKSRLALFAWALCCACAHPIAAPASPPTAASTSLAPAGPPAARTVDVVDQAFGVSVADPYRWMEGDENAELQAWLRVQGEYARTQLARNPGRNKLLARVRELGLATTTQLAVQLADERMFYQQFDPGAQLAKLMVREHDQERVLVDPAARGGGDAHASVNAYTASDDGALVAFDLALGGGEVSSMHILDVASGKELPDVIERVWGEYAASWLPDGKSFVYTQMAEPSAGVDPQFHMHVRLHVLGADPARDPELLSDALAGSFSVAPSEFPGITVTPGSPWLIASCCGAHSEVRFAIAPLAKLDRSGAGKTPWRTVAEYVDQVEGMWIHGERLYLQTFKDASNRKLISVPLSDPALAHAKLEIPEASDATLRNIVAARDAAYVLTMQRGNARLLRWPWSGKPSAIELPFEGWVDELVADPLHDGARFDEEGWTHPGMIAAIDAHGTVHETGVSTHTNADFSAIAADEVDATSSDGTQVPLTILYARAAARDGSHPALLQAYGAYGTVNSAWFDPTRLAWLERGGVFAVCHVRGGGENGRAWQDAGSREHKLNGVHDFEACAQYLIDRGFTSASRLAARGVSMGGLLVGRAVTDRPDLFAAANLAVGVVNPLRILVALNGVNQVLELGDPSTETGYKSILEMDPYQHVRADTAYPALLFTIGLNDLRVAPWMTAKLAARAQAATSSGKPVLIRTESDAGHGIGSTRDQIYAERSDVYSFFLAASGDTSFSDR